MSILEFVCLSRDEPAQIDAFAPLIPQELLPKIKTGELLALGSLLAEYPNGAAVIKTDGDRAHLCSLFVDEYDRRHGTGSELLEELCRILRSLGGIYSLEFRLPNKQNEALMCFLRKNGFGINEEESSETLVTLQELMQLKLPMPKLRTYSGTELDETVLRNLEIQLKARDAYLLEGGLNDPPIKKGLCHYAVENGAISAAAVISDETELSLAFLYGENSAAMTSVLYSAREAVFQEYGGDKLLYFNVVSEAGEKLAEKLLGKERLTAKKMAIKPVYGGRIHE